MEEFQKRKSRALAGISSPMPDKSPKGFLDAPIVPLIDAINLHPRLFTTSSCSGRISIFSHPGPESNPGSEGNAEDEGEKKERTKKKKKAGGGGWVFVTHDPADPDAVVRAVFGGGGRGGVEGGELVFRFEPLIIAVECADVESAQALVSAAISCGFRESGITSIQRRIIIAIRCSIRLEVPLGQMDSLMVPQEYVRYLVGVANDKMEANRKRTDGLLTVLRCKVLSVSTEQINANGSQFRMFDKESLLKREAKRSHPFTKEKLIEVHTSECHNLNQMVDQVNTGFSSESGEHSCENITADSSNTSSLKDLDILDELELEYSHEERTNTDSDLELSGRPKFSISVELLTTIGEPNEKLFLWGQSACTLYHEQQKQIIIFGGFGGVGRHARRNYSLMLDPQSGQLNEIEARGPPTPRLGHTASVVAEQVFIVGGREGPNQILNDVWVLHMLENENTWMLLECSGSSFQPRHRHAAAAVGSYIYIFGGLNGESIFSCMNVLNTETLHWSQVSVKAEWPSARHSHSLIANGPLLFMFGGHDGVRALGDLYSFDTRTGLWRKEKTLGRAPYSRFSHSMFIYRNYLGILGGCPLRQQNQEFSLLNLENNVWMHVKIDSVSKDLWVRSSACVIDDELVIIGGGTSCYAFGTKFNLPMKINLQLIDSFCGMTSDKENRPPELHSASGETAQGNNHSGDNSHGSSSNLGIDRSASEGEHNMGADYFVLQVEKKHAKLAKDILKKFKWLDLSRRVKPDQSDLFVHLPISKNFHSFYQKELHSVCSDSYLQGIVMRKGLPLDDISLPMALKVLLSCGNLHRVDELSCIKKSSKAPQKIMKESVCKLLTEKGMPLKLLERLPMRWERLGDIVILPVNSFMDPAWDSIGDELWTTVARSLGAQRLARQGRISPTGTRDSTLEILVGDGGWVTHQENAIIYSFDATKCMFSFGNLSEKLRMARLDCSEEIIVDLFAGIGYFVLPFLVKAKAKLVYACEWNPHAIRALRHNLQVNSVADQCIVIEGDNRVTAPKGVANRVCLGLLPSSEGSWPTAVRALRAEGGMLHIHENVKDSEEKSWLEYVVRSIDSSAQSEGLGWKVFVQHVERVKWYGPHIRHIVADVRCDRVSTTP